MLVTVNNIMKGVTMEPSLEEMDDYNKPIKPSKLKWIVIAFGIAIAVYVGYVLLMESYS